MVGRESAEMVGMGTTVRVTALSVSGDPEIDDGAGRPGRQYEVYTWASPSEGDDPSGRGYYLLDDEGSMGGSHWAYPEHIEVVMTPEQKEARTLPGLEDVRRGVASALMSMYDPIEVSEAEYDGDRCVLLTGETNDGLRVGFTVRVDQIERADW